MQKITPSVIEVLTLKNNQLRPQLGILLFYEKNRYWTVMTDGHLVTHGLSNIRLNLASTDQVLKEFNSKPFQPPGLSSKTMEKMNGIPEVLGAIRDLTRNSLQKEYYDALPLEFPRSRYDINDITLEFQKIKSGNYITSKWAAYQTILKASNFFKITEDPVKGLEIECFSKELIDFYSSIESMDKEIMQFIRKLGHKSSWSKFELKIIQLLKNAVLSSKTFPDINKTIAFEILQKTGKYSTSDSDLVVFLKESGLVAPWETFLGKYSNLKRFSEIPVVEEEAITKEFENEYSDKMLKDLKSENISGNSSEIIPKKYSWLSPIFVPEGGISDLPANDVCSNFRKDFGELPGILNFFDLKVYIIDGDVAHEVDDGFSIETRSDGVWIHVHIADPTAYLAANHPLSLFAQMRHSTIYFPERHLPLIPQKLTDEVFNLGKSPFAITFSAKINSGGDIMDYSVQPSVIRNVKHITYGEADRILEGIDEGDRIAKDLKLIKKLMDNHIEYRSAQGALNAETKGEIQLDQYPFNDSVNSWNPPPKKYPRILLDLPEDYVARIMVSECMIVAGRIGARFFSENKIPALFRGQQAPTLSKAEMQDFDTMMNKKDVKTGILPLVESRNIVKYLHRATLDTKPIRHFAMGLDNSGYVKLSSPLRRYTDLMLHWNLKAFWSKTKYPFSEADILSMIRRKTIMDKQIKVLGDFANRFWMFEWIRRRQVLYHSHSEVVKTNMFLPHESELGIPRSWTWNLKTDQDILSEYPTYDAFILEINNDRKFLKLCLPYFSNLTTNCRFRTLTSELFVGNKIKVRIHRIDPGNLEIKLDYLP